MFAIFPIVYDISVFISRVDRQNRSGSLEDLWNWNFSTADSEKPPRRCFDGESWKFRKRIGVGTEMVAEWMFLLIHRSRVWSSESIATGPSPRSRRQEVARNAGPKASAIQWFLKTIFKQKQSIFLPKKSTCLVHLFVSTIRVLKKCSTILQNKWIISICGQYQEVTTLRMAFHKDETGQG